MGQHVALSIGGHYLEMAAHGHEVRLCATGTALTPAAVFERVELPHGRIALRTLAGKYLSCQPDNGHNYGIYTSDTLGPREAFEEILYPDHTVSLRSCELTYVTASAGGGDRVVVNRTGAGAWERFTCEAVAQIPAQQHRAARWALRSPA